ncbi:MAG: hypothetical protein M1823_003876 [Watsoniomyces obsoletus]|nr:MAG: hypothetical protein M1823_003876 [Watsoniomyces obsoletus]
MDEGNNNPLFDFSAYLSTIDPSQEYTIQYLTGGIVNVTVRATKLPSSGNADRGRFPAHDTLILKYAPPYIAGVGETAPFSTFRQSTTLSDYLSCSDKTQLLDQNIPEPLFSFSFCQHLGSTLGNFFADLHSPRTLNILGPEEISKFHNPDKRDFILKEAVAPIEGILKTYGVPDAAELCQSIKADFERETSDQEKAFVLGDLWPGGILLGNDVSKRKSPPGVVDWEFAGLGRGVDGDMAQFNANLHLLLMASPSRSPLRSTIEGLIKSINDSYRARARNNGSTFLIPSTEHLHGNTPSPPSPGTARIMRSAFLEHGREMVSAAVLGNWKCLCCRVQVKETCNLIKNMVEKGAWYLQRAGSDTAAFVEDENWKLVCGEEGEIVRGLFMDG